MPRQAPLQSTVELTAPVPPITGSDSYRTALMTTPFEVAFPTSPAQAGAPPPASEAVSWSLLWLPGSGQCPDNELLRRFINALHAAQSDAPPTSSTNDGDVGQRNEDAARAVPRGTFVTTVRAVHYNDAEATLMRMMVQAGPQQRVAIGGHSAGAGAAARLAVKHDVPCVMFGASPPPAPRAGASASSTRFLVVQGENDGGAALLPASIRNRLLASAGPHAVPGAALEAPSQPFSTLWVSRGPFRVPIPDASPADDAENANGTTATLPPVSVAVPYQGDHSLRARPAMDSNKDRYTTTPETVAMNRDVARSASLPPCDDTLTLPSYSSMMNTTHNVSRSRLSLRVVEMC